MSNQSYIVGLFVGIVEIIVCNLVRIWLRSHLNDYMVYEKRG